ncbi:MAG: hypothetical protein DBP03_15445 [gamma proteobacterium symbiont of Ctena orbiculata]|nr:MAG: hypothetical protein DBP03_15445 [gamma proteobacterium symbiont of Ctena orbiculata]
MDKESVTTKEGLIKPSFRRKPESMCLIFLDPGIRRDDEKSRDDEKRVNQRFSNYSGSRIFDI